jgi:ubiquinone/menaquinone biosynthesis C-methylase UbiE
MPEAAMSDLSRRELDVRTDIDAVDALVPVAGLSLVDVGCGAGRLARDLVARGASVLAVEPDPVQAAKNRDAEPLANLAFVEARAEALPAETASADGVIFSRSLHHVPAPQMDAALREAARVLKPDGFLWIVEPAMEGTYFPVMKPFHDETTVRRQAQEALTRTALPLFGSPERYRWTVQPRFDCFEDMVSLVTGMTFNDIDRNDVETGEVRRLFERGRLPEGGYRFEQPMYLDLFRRSA